MPAFDRCHETVRRALTKDGWTITDDPLTLEFGERKLYADFGAERLLGAERGTKKIAVEIKTFRCPSPIADLEPGDWAVQSWEEYPNPDLSLFRIAGVIDTAHDRYTLTHLDFDRDRYKSSLLAYLEIRGSTIWILTDNAEEGIASELVAEGIAKDQIVLGFYPAPLRGSGDFAVV